MSRYRLHVAAAGLAAGLVVSLAGGQSIQREAFSGREPLWQRGPANVPAAVEAHVVTDAHAHSLPTAEYIRVKAEAGGQLDPAIYYSYPTHPAPVADDLTVRVWVKSSRPGVQLLA